MHKITRVWLLVLLVLSALPGRAELIDVTGMFAEETRWLADNVAKETRDEFLFRTSDGINAYADSKPPEVGDVEVFNTFNITSGKHERVRARLQKIGKHCYIYLQEGKKVATSVISRIASEFDTKIYSNTRSMFGSEWTPGIDGDPRITLFLLDIQDGHNPAQGRRGYTAGYFYAGDCYNRKKKRESNEREMLYLDIYPSVPGSQEFMSVVAHEFQHMIHWNNDPKEFTWVNESLSQLSQFLCGYGHPPQLNAFIRNTHNNLAAWADDDMLANYGQVYLWAYYISIRIASTDDRRRAFVRRMVAQTSQGFSGLNAAIKKQGIKNNVRNLFRSFCLANYLNDNRIERGAYGYDKPLAKFALRPELRLDKPPFEVKGRVKCWAARAVQVNMAGLRGKDVAVMFAGQKVQASNYSNSFDVALVTYSSNRKSLPTVEWLNIKDYKASQRVKISSVHDRMLMLVVNRGPEVMKVEQAFARGASPAAFSFAIRPNGSTSAAPRVASTSTARTSRSRPNRARSRSIIEEIASSPGLEESAGTMLSSRGSEEEPAAEVEFDFGFQKLAENEDLIIDAVREEMAENSCEVLDEFVNIYASASDLAKSRLHTLRSRIRDILMFEQLQGNQLAEAYLSRLQ
ncbi:MAG: hypothetical protein CVV42_15765 [Candidatus Riflebacteria bacterium HGW-Riflebacteria-2]|jgi:hypothetical protein|nr:MAG: hypothetical protein CVV42_15765 [Candidatus Riflebacteria bacterium HGW-Riflebacteria-2]